jgi:hypothetical protein
MLDHISREKNHSALDFEPFNFLRLEFLDTGYHFVSFLSGIADVTEGKTGSGTASICTAVITATNVDRVRANLEITIDCSDFLSSL